MKSRHGGETKKCGRERTKFHNFFHQIAPVARGSSRHNGRPSMRTQDLSHSLRATSASRNYFESRPWIKTLGGGNVETTSSHR